MPRHYSNNSVRFDASWLTRIALVWTLSIVAARMVTTDALREPFEAIPSGSTTLRSPGPATGLTLDLLACVPALLVLARRAIDPSWTIRFRWSPMLFGLLALCCVASTWWASDKFAAVVAGLHIVTAAVVLWTMSQLIRSWSQFRLVSAVAGGLLLVLVAQSLTYKFVDVPQSREYWTQNRVELLKARGLEPGSFSANLFERKMVNGDLVGFFTSVNTFGTMGVLLFAACVGIGIFRFRAGDRPNWLIATGVAVASLVWILYQAQSKTSGATPFVGVAVVAVWAVFGHRLKYAPGRTYLYGVGAVLLAAAIVIGIGLKTGHLFAGHFSNSLDFRWKYWTASVGVFKEHPLLGVGYANFGPHYLAHRRPEAAEEVIDPHNLVVRCFTELGIVGGILLLAWIARLGWELIRPADESPDSIDPPPITADPMVIAAVAMVIAMIAKIDFDYSLTQQITTVLPFLIYGLVLLFGALAGSLLDPTSNSIDPRPAKWIYACLATGLGLFLVANMIDFSWREPGALLPFAMLAGSAVAMTRTPIGRPGMSKVVPTIGLAIAVMAWIAVAGAVVFPIIGAESSVGSANNLIAEVGPTDRSAGQQIKSAISHYRDATVAVPYDADYRYQLARAEWMIRDSSAATDSAAAIAGDPTRIHAWLLDSQIHAEGPSPDAAVVVRDFAAAVRLDPNDVDIRTRFAEALEKFHRHDEAVAQYRAALAANGALPAEEPKRLSPKRLAELQKLAE